MSVFSFFERLLNRELVNLPTPTSLSYWWGFGVCLGSVYLIQVISGVLLSLLYNADSSSFSVVVSIMQDVNYGWVLRFVHSAGVGLFFLLLYGHIYRSLLYGGFMLSGVWWSGIIILVLLMGVAFFGYVLPWGSMSYWGIVVVTSILGAIPYLGVVLMEFLWGGSSPGSYSVARFFSLHYILSLFVLLLVLVHLYELHQEGSSNPLGVGNSGVDALCFYESFVYKDVVGLAVVLLFYWVFVLIIPYALLDANNFEEVDVAITPTHIKPEWYFLFLYCILRSVPSNVGGVVLMGAAILVLWCFPYFSSFSTRSGGLSSYKIWLLCFSVSFVLLTLLGGLAVEAPFSWVGFLASSLYFISVLGLWCSLLVQFWADGF